MADLVVMVQAAVHLRRMEVINEMLVMVLGVPMDRYWRWLLRLMLLLPHRLRQGLFHLVIALACL